MSASERLLQLANDSRWHDHSGPQPLAEMGMLVGDALPEIVAIVKAAEEVSGPFRTIDPNVQNTLRPALAALDEKLADAAR